MVKPQVTNRFLLPKNHGTSKPNSLSPQFLTKGTRNTSGTFPFHCPPALAPQRGNPKRLSASIPKLGFSSQSHSAPAPVCICPLESQAEKAQPETGAGLPNQSTTSLHPFTSHFSMGQGWKSQKSTGGIRRRTHMAGEVGGILRKKKREKGIQEKGKGGFQLAKRDAELQRQKDQLKAAKKKK